MNYKTQTFLNLQLKELEEIEKRGEVEIYGIGIEDGNVSRLYKDWKVINHSDELEGALLELISTKILN